jgi:hypothetical protein
MIRFIFAALSCTCFACFRTHPAKMLLKYRIPGTETRAYATDICAIDTQFCTMTHSFIYTGNGTPVTLFLTSYTSIHTCFHRFFHKEHRFLLPLPIKRSVAGLIFYQWKNICPLKALPSHQNQEFQSGSVPAIRPGSPLNRSTLSLYPPGPSFWLLFPPY